MAEKNRLRKVLKEEFRTWTTILVLLVVYVTLKRIWT